MQVLKDKFDSIKLKINRYKNLATMIDNKRYTLIDVNKLVNKIAEQKISKNKTIKKYNDLVNKAKQIAQLRWRKKRKRFKNNNTKPNA